MKTDTPRTDEWLAEEKRNPRLSGLGKWLDYCKQLERELTAARAEIAELNEEYGTWWAQKSIALDELKEVTEQRDRLADLVKQFIYILDITEESDGGRLFHPTNITSCRAGDLQKAGQLVEALRRTVKGGSDEPQG